MDILTWDEICAIAREEGHHPQEIADFAQALETKLVAKLRSQQAVAWRYQNEFGAWYTCGPDDTISAEYKGLLQPLYAKPVPALSEGDRRDAERLAFELIDKWLGLGPDGAEHVRAQLAAMSKEQGNG